MIVLFRSPNHRDTGMYPFFLIAVNHTTILNSAVINSVGLSRGVPRKLLGALLRVNAFAPAVVDFHLQADEIALQLWDECVVEPVTVRGDDVGDSNLAGSAVEMDGIVGGVAFGLQAAVLGRTVALVVDCNAQWIGIFVGRH